MDAAANKGIGKAKEVAGRVSGDQDLVDEGKVQHATGTAQGAVRDAGRKVQDALGSMGKKLAANRRKKAGERPERSRR